MERAYEILPLRKIDPHLPADRSVHLPDERRRHRDPVDPAHVRGGNEADDVRRRAATERDECRTAVELERSPETLRFGCGLRTGDQAGRDIVELGDASIRDERVSTRFIVRREADTRGGQEHAVEVTRTRIGCFVERQALVVERSERLRVASKRPSGSGHAIPGLVGFDLDVHAQGELGEQRTRALRGQGATAELDDRERTPREHVRRRLLLQLAKGCLAAGLEQVADGSSRSLFDDRIDGYEWPAEPLGERRA